MRSLQESSRLGRSFLPRKHRAAIYRAAVLTESQSSFGRGSTCGLRSGGGERSRYRNWLLQTVGGVQTCHRSRDFLEVSLKVVSQYYRQLNRDEAQLLVVTFGPQIHLEKQNVITGDSGDTAKRITR